MRDCPRVERVLHTVVLLTFLHPERCGLAADDEKGKAALKTGGTVTGLVMDMRDTWIMVKSEGETEAVKYVWGDASVPNSLKTLPHIFPVARVQLTYKLKGDTRHIVSIKKKESKSTGSVTGTVVQNHQWWVEVKPRNGPTEGYAVHYPFDQHLDTMETVKGLKEGDVVTIRFTTDFERHRIEAIRKHKPTGK